MICKIASAARNWINYVPLKTTTIFAFPSVFSLLLCYAMCMAFDLRMDIEDNVIISTMAPKNWLSPLFCCRLPLLSRQHGPYPVLGQPGGGPAAPHLRGAPGGQRRHRTRGLQVPLQPRLPLGRVEEEVPEEKLTRRLTLLRPRSKLNRGFETMGHMGQPFLVPYTALSTGTDFFEGEPGQPGLGFLMQLFKTQFPYTPNQCMEKTEGKRTVAPRSSLHPPGQTQGRSRTPTPSTTTGRRSSRPRKNLTWTFCIIEFNNYYIVIDIRTRRVHTVHSISTSWSSWCV